MMSFRIAALALPAAAAFLAPALWEWKREWKLPAIGVGGLIGLVFAWGLVAGSPVPGLLAVSVVALSFALFALGLSMAAGQVVSGLAVVLVCSTLFLAPSVVEEAAMRNRRDLAQSRLDLMLSVSPWAAIAAGPYKLDLLRDFPSIYRTHMADYVDARPPSWGSLAAGYALAGLLLGAAAVGARRIRRPLSSSPIANPPSSP